MARKFEIAYTVNVPRSGGEFEIRKSANAWWMNKGKVDSLFAIFALDPTINEACAYIEITERQYKYFARLHPRIREVRARLSALVIIRARKTVVAGITGDKRFAMKYLQKKRPEEFGSPSRRKKNGQQVSEQSGSVFLPARRSIND